MHTKCICIIEQIQSFRLVFFLFENDMLAGQDKFDNFRDDRLADNKEFDNHSTMTTIWGSMYASKMFRWRVQKKEGGGRLCR